MRKIFYSQFLPILLTFLTFILLSLVLFLFINALNLFGSQKIVLQLKLTDILIGLTIYLKTSIDFVIFIGNLMKDNPGWKNRIAIELGTSFGNGIGTLLILIIWYFFKEVKPLLIIMVFIASLVLLKMAQEGIEDFIEVYDKNVLTRPIKRINLILSFINKCTSPIISRIIPSGKIGGIVIGGFFMLFIFSIRVPFVLGLDDFAGYIPLFSIVNVFGFSVGVFLAHMIVTSSLFISPKTTTKLIEYPLVILIGSFAFILIALYGFIEILRAIFVLI